MALARVSAAQWNAILDAEGASLLTPGGNRNFRVGSGSADHIDVFTGGSQTTRVRLARQAFEQTLEYLMVNGHVDEPNAIAIRANQNPEIAGALCRAARERADGSYGARVVTYVLPLLEFIDVIGIRRTAVPATTWVEPS